MCGIAGALVPKGRRVKPGLLKAMTDVIAHRGPDGTGAWISEDGRVGLGHRRLSIIDLSSAGDQPMRSASRRYVISYNGEIYNFRELRSELERKGAEFRGHSDTEVILAACDAWGPQETLRRLSGMFAIALWDCQEEEILLARDRIGIKPLYYSLENGELTFASELRPLVVWRGNLPPVSRQGLTEFLRLGYVPGPLSIFDGVHKLQPGTWLRYKGGQATHGAFWRYRDVVRDGMNDAFDDESEALDALDETLRASVSRHMISDVPLGAFLSGGIDSSTVVALMQAQSDRPVKTFSIGFNEAAYNEAEHAAAVARHLGTDHTELYVSDQDAREVIPDLPRIYDEPFADVSQIPTFLVSRLAREHVTVSLSGDGGDELFAGYNRYYFVTAFWTRLKMLPAVARRALAGALVQPSPSTWDRFFKLAGRAMPASLVPALPGQKMHKIAATLPAKSLLDLHVRLVSQWVVPQLALRERWRSDDILWHGRLCEDEGLSPAMRQSVWDAETYLVDDILTKVDRATMSVSLEGRVPLLDPQVMEIAWRVPAHMKLRDGGGKWLLKQLLHRYVPAEIVERPKMGFGVPIGDWLASSLRDWGESLLDPGMLDQQGYLNTAAIRQTWDQHVTGRQDSGGPLWTVLMFQHWLDQARKWV